MLTFFLMGLPLCAGVFICNSSCFSKVASVTAIAANAKNLVAGAKKIRHPKATKAKRT